MTFAWLYFYGRKLNMNRREVLYTRFGEMRDLITCYQIEKGELLPKKEKRHWTYDEAMALL